LGSVTFWQFFAKRKMVAFHGITISRMATIMGICNESREDDENR
jgi:hypothetical protein